MIIENKLPQVGRHKVVVLTITYNHSKYIEDTLMGFSIQQTDFPFLCCVFDDASTDGEQEVLRRWIDDHCNSNQIEIYDHPITTILVAPDNNNPNCIYVIHLQKVNTWGKTEKEELLNYWKKQGEYIALCEGDDYWINPLKLQKQVGFLDENPEYSMCFANAKEHYEDGRKKDDLFSKIENRDYSGIEIFNKWIVPTASVLYRNHILESQIYKNARDNKNFVYGDIVLFLSCAYEGKIRGMQDVVSVYRRHQGGITFVQTVEMSRRLMKHNNDIPVYFGDEYLRTAKEKIVFHAIYGFKFSKYKEISLMIDSLKLMPIYTIYKFLRMSYFKLKNVISRKIKSSWIKYW